MLAAEPSAKLRAREAVLALRAAAGSGGDIYLRYAALRSVLAIEGTRSPGSWPKELGSRLEMDPADPIGAAPFH